MSKINTFVKYLVEKPQRLFVVLSFVFGFAFIIAIPPLQAPDEASHFLRAYQISEGKLVSGSKDGITGDSLPVSLEKSLEVLTGPTPIQFKSQLKYKMTFVKKALFIELNQTDRKYYDLSAASGYSPVGYIPQALAIGVGRLFDTPPVLLLYMARLAVLCAWVAIGYLSIRLMPFKKWALFGILLFPMFTAQSVSVGVDALSVGAGVLFIAAILRAVFDKRFTRNLGIVIGTAAIVMVMSKQIMAVLLPLVFLLKDKYFESKKLAWIVRALVLIVPVLMFLGWMLAVGPVSPTADQLANNQNDGLQIKQLLEDPLHFVVVLFNTFFFGWGNSVTQSIIGVFGWADTPLSESFIAFGFIALAVLLFTNYSEQNVLIAFKTRILFGLLSVIYFLVVCAAMYVFYSPVGFSIVVGVQGRYLLPILVMLIPVCYGFAVTTKKKYIALTLLSVGILFFASLATIIFRYYIEYTY